MPLDRYVERNPLGLPRVMKIDAEGYEVEILRGAEALLSQPLAPDILLEVNAGRLAAAGSSPSVLLELLKQTGYSVYAIPNGPGLRPFALEPGRLATNSYATKRRIEKRTPAGRTEGGP
jgi:hypothetical protein